MQTTRDVIVVGAGSTGAALAARLAAGAPELDVLLVEAGPDYPDLEQLPDDLRYGTPSGTVLLVGDEHNWSFVGRANHLNDKMPVARGKVTGGSSAINGQIFLRGVPEDYDGWAAAGNDGWDFQSVLKHFRRSEDDRHYAGDLHGTGGPIPVGRFAASELRSGHRAFLEACRAFGFAECPDANDPDSTGIGPYPLNCPDGIRVSTAIGYLPAVRELSNFTLLPDTMALRVLFEGTRAVGVEVERGGERHEIYGREIVLSTGAVGSPQLLMLSGVGPREQLEAVGITQLHDLPGVGKHLQDHPTAYLVWQLAPEHVSGPRDPLVQMLLRYTAAGSSLRNDMYVCPLTWRDTMMMVPGVHAVRGEGELRLLSGDPHVQPLLDYRYLEDDEDRRRLREGVRLCLALSELDPFRDLLGPRVTPTDAELATDETLDGWLDQVVNTSHHISGTCKMGPAEDPLAVVSDRCQVRGVQGLRVADASIIPELPRANPNATAIMIGEKLADLMLNDLRLGG